jgi:hypothetical protein
LQISLQGIDNSPQPEHLVPNNTNTKIFPPSATLRSRRHFLRVIHRLVFNALLALVWSNSQEKKGRELGMKPDLYELQEEDFENLPDATEQLRFLAPAVVEVLAGVRTVEQLSPMLSETIYLKLRDRAARAARSRNESNSAVQRPNFVVSKLHQESHRPGVIQSVVLIRSNLRTRAVAIRLESRNRRWLATAVSIL